MMNFNSDHYVKQMNGGKSKSLNLSLKRFNPSKSSLKRFNPSKSSLKRFNPSIRLNPKYKPKLDKFVKFFKTMYVKNIQANTVEQTIKNLKLYANITLNKFIKLKGIPPHIRSTVREYLIIINNTNFGKKK